jgi:predicted CXXCH cytochrome family protein
MHPSRTSRGCRSWPSLLALIVLIVLVVLGAEACARGHASGPAVARPTAAQPARVRSNILRADYVGSRECRLCHAEIYQAWTRSPMHRMTRRAASAEIKAPFDGTTFHLRNDWVRMERLGQHELMRLSNKDGMRLYRITKVIGGRYREDFAGIDVTDAADPARDRGRGAEQVMPVSYVFSTKSWRPKGYSVMVTERPGLAAGPVWAAVCIGCHNTLPYLTYLSDDLYGPEPKSYHGRVSSHLMPPSRLWVATAVDPERLKRALGDEVAFLGGKPRDPAAPLLDVLDDATAVARRRLQGAHLIEVGVGCEACHGGAREHANDPSLLPAFGVRSPLLRLGPKNGAEPTRAQQINHVCVHCHTVLFSGYPFTWEGGRRKGQNPGGSSTNSGEARDLLLGGCSSQLSCTACHDPHAEDQKDHLRALAGTAGNALCARCHAELGSKAALAAHTHHAPDGEGSACVGCHMPRKNMGLDYTLTRYHRIGSPTDDARVLGDRPLECALCHTDKNVEELVGAMERFWGKQYDRQVLRQLYGDDLHTNVLASTLARGKPHEQAVAVAVLGEKGDKQALPGLAAQLSHAYPLVRHFAKRAIETITGEPLEVDVNAPAADAAAQAQRWVDAYTHRADAAK